jgi:hypothetical protein
MNVAQPQLALVGQALSPAKRGIFNGVAHAAR